MKDGIIYIRNWVGQTVTGSIHSYQNTAQLIAKLKDYSMALIDICNLFKP